MTLRTWRWLPVLAGLALAATMETASGRTKKKAQPDPVLKGAGAVDLEELLSKNPFPEDERGPLHAVPIAIGRVPGAYSVAGLLSRRELPLHMHRLRAEIIYVLSGSGSFFLGKETHAVKPGMVFHVPVGTAHGFKLDADAKVFWVAVGKFKPKDHVLVRIKAEAGNGDGGGSKGKADKIRKTGKPDKAAGSVDHDPGDVVTPSTLR